MPFRFSETYQGSGSFIHLLYAHTALTFRKVHPLQPEVYDAKKTRYYFSFLYSRLKFKVPFCHVPEFLQNGFIRMSLWDNLKNASPRPCNCYPVKIIINFFAIYLILTLATVCSNEVLPQQTWLLI